MRASFERLAVTALSALLLAGAARAEEGAWKDLRADLFQAREIVEDGRAVKLFGPRSAEDAALVPVTIYIAADLVSQARQLTLVIDENPAPVAAVLRFADAYRNGGDVGDRTIEARIRLETMTRVRAILETGDGTLYAASQFIAGSGGCTSTALKDMDEAMAGIGRTRLRVADDATRSPLWREVQVQIRHPNFSGLQIDTRTNRYTPAVFVDRIHLEVGQQPLVSIESGIAISEDPFFRLSFAGGDRAAVSLVAHDTDGRTFRSRAE
ncbi:MAG: quinoprotein dehydrogenase-associated SoxYZ-like carrier [Rhizobiales bacterium]|nr:quinoprotein dehydrogenase-associated SoxYZ-like carrier [Hyphomicrobiales bacterium]